MGLSAFDDRSAVPDAAAVALTLGRTAGLWGSVKERLGAEFANLTEEWTFSGQAYGWSLRLKQNKRVIVYLTPREKHFLASFALGGKACLAAQSAGLAPDVLAMIDAAPRYAEGRGVRIPVRKRSDVDQVIRIARVKMAN